jgi:hypothetical protein
MLASIWRRFGARDTASPAEWCGRFVHELVSSGALAIEDGVVVDR